MNRLCLFGALFNCNWPLRGRVVSAISGFVAASLVGGGALFADNFGSGANSFSIDFVTIGNPGNAPDANPNPAGAVPYEYRIGKYEISEQMIDKANAESALSGSPLGITKDMRGSDKPATNVTWYEAAKFVNWLNTSTGSVPAYKFDASGNFQLWAPIDPGYEVDNLYRNKQAMYFLPSLNEWHKAAYYDPVADVYYDYPTGSDTVPDGIDFVADPIFDAIFFEGGLNPEPNSINNVGRLSPFGTAGQGGNVAEWLETGFDRTNSTETEPRIRAGGSWVDISTLLAASNPSGAIPSNEQFYHGFRIASVIPEPEAIGLLSSGFLMLICSRVICRNYMQRHSFG
jgi:hypothetical protein